MTLTHVMTPIKLGNLEIKNRIVRSAHATNIGAGTMTDELIAYHELRAKGGVGLSFLEILSVHKSSPYSLHIWSPGMEEGYRKLTDRVRPTGMKLFQQFWHGGHGTIPLDRSAPWSASEVMSSGVGITPKAMTKAMIDEVVEAFGEAARKVESWGIEGGEVHGAHGYLPHQFLRQSHNRRTDEYGGSFENRARFLIEILQAMRAATTKNFVLGVRLGADESWGGMEPGDLLKLTNLLESKGLIDFVNMSLANKTNSTRQVGGMHEPTGYMLPTSTPVTRNTKLPSIVIGRFRTLEEADTVIRAGDASMVAINRAFIADPDLVTKTLAGHPEQVRPCIACNQGCLGGAAGLSLWDPRARMGCAVNPGAGREMFVGDHLLTQAEKKKHILVIGGGVSGMEAARVAAMRGHKVTLAEAQPDLGGTLNIAAMAPMRATMRDIVVWLEDEIRRLGVDVRLNTYMEASDVRDLNPDEVIVATGASPSMDGMMASNPGEKIHGFDQPHVVSSNDLLTAPKQDWGKTAVVLDDIGQYEAVAVAEHLVSKGVAVTFVTRHDSIAQAMRFQMTIEPALERLSRGDFRIMTHSHAIAVEGKSVVVGPTYRSNQTTTLPADTVVFVSGNRPNMDVLEGMPPSLPTHLVGDVNGPRYLQSAIAEGHKIAAVI